jgi:hypothetical protein
MKNGLHFGGEVHPVSAKAGKRMGRTPFRYCKCGFPNDTRSTAWAEGARGHVVDYGQIAVASDALGEEAALAIAFAELDDLAQLGFPMERDTSVRMPVRRVVVDSSHFSEIVYVAVRQRSPRWWPSKGYGEKVYRHPTFYAIPDEVGHM